MTIFSPLSVNVVLISEITSPWLSRLGVKSQVILAPKVRIGIAKSHYAVETPRPFDNRRIKALGSIGGGDRDHPIFGGDAVEAVE